MEGFNNYTGHMSYISTWEERQRKMQQNKADVKRDRFDLFNDLGIESKEVIDGIGDCSKCFYKYDCKYKGQGLTHVCSNRYKDSSEHDKKVWDSAIDEVYRAWVDWNSGKFDEEYFDFVIDKLKEKNNE